MKNDELQTKTLFDQSYLEQSTPLHLSLLIRHNKSFAAYLDTKKNKYVGFIEFENKADFDTSNLLANETFVRSNVTGISLYLQNNTYTLVPASYYEEENKKDLLSFNLGESNPGDLCLNQKIVSLDSELLFYCPDHVLQLWNKEFPGISIKHAQQTLLESYSSLLNDTDEYVFVHFYDKSFDLAIYRAKKLINCNSFTFQTAEDFLYFFLYAIEQENINREKGQFYFAGLIDKNSPIYELSYRYIGEITFLNEPKSTDYSSPLFEQNLAHHYCLFNQYLCE